MHRPPSRGRPAAVAFAVTGGLLACGGSSPTGADAPSAASGRVAVVAGGVADTILAAPVQALVVEVRGADGAVASGRVVRFDVQPAAPADRPAQRALYVCALADAVCGYDPSVAIASTQVTTTDTTDAAGRAKAVVRFGSIAGPAYVVVTVPALGVRDSVPFVVRPGAAVYIGFASRDTAVLVGGRVTVRAGVLDAWSNLRPDAVAFALGGAAETALGFDPASATATGVDVGAGYVVARGGGRTDSVAVRVVPAGRLLLVEQDSGAVRLVSTDGRAPRTLRTDSVLKYAVSPPRFSPRGDVLAFAAGTASSGARPQRILVLDTLGALRREIALPAGAAQMGYPRPMADGSVRFVAFGEDASRSYQAPPAALYAAGVDGTVTRIGALPDSIVGFSNGIEISPDGGRVAYVAYDPARPSGAAGLRVFTVATGQVTVVDPSGVGPAWSPAGDRIAYLVAPSPFNNGGPLAVAAPDGSNRATYAAAGTFAAGLGWSPDGAFVLAGNYASGYGSGSRGPTVYPSLRAVRLRDGASVALLPRYGADFGANGYYRQGDWR